MKQSIIEELTAELRAFRDARDWSQFHNAKDLAAALAIEAAELQELFLWKSATQCESEAAALRPRAAEEIADVAAFLLLLCDRMEIDLAEALRAKMRLNAEKYPVDKARGSARKYTAYHADSTSV